MSRSRSSSSSSRERIASTSGALKISELSPGMRAQGIFVVKKKICREQSSGSKFLLFQFGDRSGQINGIMWEDVDSAQHAITSGDLAHVEGDVQLYQNTRQIRVRSIDRADPTAYDVSEFLPTSVFDLDTLFDQVLTAAASVQNPFLHRLYGELLADPEIRTRYQHAPAGRGWHHAYVGGMMEHVVGMLELGEVVARQRSHVDRDLMIGGIVFHDIGKVEELAFKRHIEYTNSGRLLGHLVQGSILVSRFMDRIEGFPEDLRNQLLHVIVSHHGALERGSPKPPMTLEAMVVHLLDHLDSQAQAIEQVVSRCRSEDGWSEHVRLLDRFFYCGDPDQRLDGGDHGG